MGQYSITPTLDFDQEMPFSQAKNFGLPKRDPIPFTIESKATAGNRENSGSGGSFSNSETERDRMNQKNWQMLYEGLDEFGEEPN